MRLWKLPKFSVAAASAVAAGLAGAQETWRVIVPSAAGGANDVLARMIAEKMQEATGNVLVVDNIPGANTNIGTSAVAKAAPDGKTILVTSEGYVTVNLVLCKDAAHYDPASLEAVRLVAVQPAVLAASADSPIRTLEDLVRKGRGIGSTGHLTTELLGSAVGGMSLVHVPFPDGAPAGRYCGMGLTSFSAS